MRKYVRCPRCGYQGTVTMQSPNALTPQQKFLLSIFGIALVFLFCVIGVIIA